MLSEQLMTQVKDLTMLQINTDGLTARIPVTQKRIFYDICKAWEKQTRLILEYASYDIMVIRDVNSYLAKSPKGKIKRKGAFVTYAQMLEEESYHKSVSQPIVPYAIEKYFLEGVPVEDTIMRCTDIYDFCKMFNASHGWDCELVSNDTIVSQQKTNRYFISTNGKTFRKTKEDKVIEIEAGGKLVTIFNDFVQLPIIDYNIDYDYYIQECYKIIHKIDGTKERLLQEQKEQKEANKRMREEENFLKYCINKVPTVRQLGLYGKEWLLEKYGTPKTK